MADDDQISFLAVGIERRAIIAWERTVFEIVPQMCVSSCRGCQHQRPLEFDAVAKVKVTTVAMDFGDITYHALWIYLVGHSQCPR
jgi:hypothetical protein